MSNLTCMYWLQAITPLHVGSGKGVGFIDMPIMREKVTNWPIVPGSAVKGVMRDHFEFKGDETQKSLLTIAFGKGGDDSANAGSLVLTDAHIVLLPVRSIYGTFAYITSPLVLHRLVRDLKMAKIGHEDIPSPGERDVLLVEGSKLVSDGRVYFEDLDFDGKVDPSAKKWAERLSKSLFPGDSAWRAILQERFAIVNDDCFTFLSETGTEVSAHIRIKDETKIVEKGALWYEETLPTESILSGIAWCDRIFPKGPNDSKERERMEEIMNNFCPATGLDLQLGGRATVGKGQVKIAFSRS